MPYDANYFDRFVAPAAMNSYVQKLDMLAGNNAPRVVYNQNYREPNHDYLDNLSGGTDAVDQMLSVGSTENPPDALELLGRQAPGRAGFGIGADAPSEEEKAGFVDAWKSQQRTSMQNAARDAWRVQKGTATMTGPQRQEAWNGWRRKHPEFANVKVEAMDSAQLQDIISKTKLGEAQDRMDAYAKQNGLPTVPLEMGKDGTPTTPAWYEKAIDAQNKMQVEKYRQSMQAAMDAKSDTAETRAKEQEFQFRAKLLDDIYSSRYESVGNNAQAKDQLAQQRAQDMIQLRSSIMGGGGQQQPDANSYPSPATEAAADKVSGVYSMETIGNAVQTGEIQPNVPFLLNGTLAVMDESGKVSNVR